MNSLPFSLKSGEEIKCCQPGVAYNMKYLDDQSYSLGKGTLVLTTQRIIFFQMEPRKVLLYILYPNAITHGINKTDLYIIVSDLAENDAPEPEEDDMEEEELDPFVEKLKTVNGFNEEDEVKIVGHYEVIFDFKETGLAKLDEVFKIFSECSALNPDDATSEENNIFDNDFITANDIDENGNVILDEGDDDGDDDEVDDNGIIIDSNITPETSNPQSSKEKMDLE